MDISIPSLSNMPPTSAQNMSLPSTHMGSHHSPSSLRLPLFYMAAQACRDKDLSHLNHCLHHIVRWRTSSPILTDRTTRQQGSSHGNGTIYNLQVNGIQCLGSSTTTSIHCMWMDKIQWYVRQRRHCPWFQKTRLLYLADIFDFSTFRSCSFAWLSSRPFLLNISECSRIPVALQVCLYKCYWSPAEYCSY